MRTHSASKSRGKFESYSLCLRKPGECEESTQICWSIDQVGACSVAIYSSLKKAGDEKRNVISKTDDADTNDVAIVETCTLGIRCTLFKRRAICFIIIFTSSSSRSNLCLRSQSFSTAISINRYFPEHVKRETQKPCILFVYETYFSRAKIISCVILNDSELSNEIFNYPSNWRASVNIGTDIEKKTEKSGFRGNDIWKSIEHVEYVWVHWHVKLTWKAPCMRQWRFGSGEADALNHRLRVITQVLVRSFIWDFSGAWVQQFLYISKEY